MQVCKEMWDLGNGQDKIAGNKWMDFSLRVSLYVYGLEHRETHYGNQGSPHQLCVSAMVYISKNIGTAASGA